MDRTLDLKDGTKLFYRMDSHGGTALVFQHGLGADGTQPMDLLGESSIIRRISVDCRLHGKTRTGSNIPIGFNTFADDLTAALDHEGIRKPVVGGISMGAGVAVNFYCRYPARVRGLILCRPAWTCGPMEPDLVALFDTVKDALRFRESYEVSGVFKSSSEFTALQSISPDAAGSFLKQFEAVGAEEYSDRLGIMPRQSPVVHLDEYKAIRVPTLILATKGDALHPWRYAEQIANIIEGSQLLEVASKAGNPEIHQRQVRDAVYDFMRRITG